MRKLGASDPTHIECCLALPQDAEARCSGLQEQLQQERGTHAEQSAALAARVQELVGDCGGLQDVVAELRAALAGLAGSAADKVEMLNVGRQKSCMVDGTPVS